MTFHTVLAISPDPDYLDEVADVLSELHVLAVLAEGVKGASNAIADGFTPGHPLPPEVPRRAIDAD